ncbi:hypothetical protein [Stenotrophomonas maltophilia]|uniref:hypothetical protein n=1 Tax=Stenotrophomonas maltophilia TaxID=40324 RepID=UPI0013DBCD1B|nr:hypothetical protein [Stenotrophomonas maltophilia]
MALQEIDIDTVQPNGKRGDPARVMAQKINANDAYLEDLANTKLSAPGGRIKSQLLVEQDYALVGFFSPGAASEQSFVGGWNNTLIQRVWNPAGNHGVNDSVETTLDYVGGFKHARNGVLQFEIGPNGNVYSSVTGVNPSAGVTSFAVRASGSFGGGFGLIDGGATYGIYLSAGNFYIGYGGLGSGISPRFTMTNGGVCSATSFNPTSSADVKDFIEGYAGDACTELDRLVVVSYRYRPEFVESEKVYVGLLAENVRDVHANATDGGTEVVIEPDPKNGQGQEPIVVKQPLNIDMMQVLAITVRAHQQKSRRIAELERQLSGVLDRLATIESQL